jgi:hypothetical protein
MVLAFSHMARAFVAVFICLITTTVQAQSPPSKKEATALLQKAMDMAMLEDDGVPFHLLAKIHYDAYSRASDGTYELLWSAPDRFREEFRLGTLGETDVVIGDKRYVLRTGPALQLALWRLRSLLNSPLAVLAEPKLRASKVWWSPGVNPEICVSAGGSLFIDKQACFDTGSSTVVSVKVASRNNSNIEMRLDDFVAVGPKRYPRRLFSHMGAETLEVKVENVEQTSQFAESVFLPPVGATVFPWCPDAVQRGSSHPPRVSSPFYAGNLAYYLLIGRDGHVITSIPLLVPNQRTERDTTQWLRKAKFSIELCHSQPIEYETIYEEFAIPLGGPLRPYQ